MLDDLISGITSKATRRQKMAFDPETYYHASRNDFDEFGDETWPHVGTKAQANRRLKQTRWLSGTGSEHIMPLHIRKQNPLLMRDTGDWKQSSICCRRITSDA